MKLNGKLFSVVVSLLVMVINGVSQKTIQTPADAAALRDLIHQVDQAKDRGYTQTEAHLSLPAVQEFMHSVTDLAADKNIIQKILAKEREMQDYYVFYTAVPGLQLFQDVTRKMYKRVVGNVGALQNKEFQFIRFEYNDPMYAQYKNATDFLVKEITEHGIIDDNQLRIKTILVSANIALFSGAGAPTGESTWGFFHTPQWWFSRRDEWLKDAIKSYGYSTLYAKKIMELQPLVDSVKSNLFQIFVPKKLVDDVGYLSWRHGIPYDHELIRKILGRNIKTLGVQDSIYDLEIKNRLYTVSRLWKKNDPQIRAICATMVEHAKRGNYRLSPALDVYKQQPTEVLDSNFQQVRLLVTNDMLLNPESGIKIYRYAQANPKQAEYKAKLRKVMLEMDAMRKRLRK